MIWTYVGVGLTIFFGGMGIGTVLGMWIGKMVSAQEHHAKEIERLNNELSTMRLVQEIVVDRRAASRRSVSLADLPTRRPSDDE